MMQNLQLEADELTFYFETNGTIATDRFAMFLELLGTAWRTEDLPPYALDILELKTGSLFGKLRLRFLDALSTEAAAALRERVEELERRLNTDERALDAAIRSAEASERQARAAEADNDIQRAIVKATRLGIAVSAGLATAGLVYGIARDAMREEGNYCADLIAQIMDKDGVSSIELAGVGCRMVLKREDVPAYRRRIETPPPPADDDLRMAPLRSNGIEFPGSAHFPSGTDRPLETLAPATATDGSGGQRGDRARGIDTARPAARGAILSASGVRFSAAGRILNADNIYLFLHDNDPDKRVILIPPQGQALADGHRYEVTGRLFTPHGGVDIIAADLMQPLE